MKKLIWVVGGVCAAAAGLLVLQGKRETVRGLAEQLETGWASEHHTVV